MDPLSVAKQLIKVLKIAMQLFIPVPKKEKTNYSVPWYGRRGAAMI